MSRTTYIYALVDPRDQTCQYIGKTIQQPPRNRLRQHLLTPETEGLAQWANELEDAGLKPEFKILESVPSEADWRASEIYWIRYGLAQGWCLRNRASGGDNYPLDLLGSAKADHIIPRILYASEATLRLLTSINSYVMKGKPAEYNTFRDLFHTALLLTRAENTPQFAELEQELLNYVLTNGIIKMGRGWRVPVMKKQNLVGGEFLAVGKPFAINGISIPGRFDQSGWRVTIRMYKRTSELLDELATEMVNERRRGYADVLLHAFNVMARVFDRIVNL